jgi:hypothetical protein
MTEEQLMAELTKRRKARRKQVRSELMKLAGIGQGGRPPIPGHDQWGPNHSFMVPEQKRAGQIDVRRGIMPSDAQIDEVAKQAGAHEEADIMRQISALRAQRTAPPVAPPSSPSSFGGPGGVAGSPRATESQTLADLLKEQKAQLAAYNAEQKLRYESGLQEHTDLRGRNQGRLDTLGQTQRTLNQEKLEEAMLNINAEMADRGLAGSGEPARMKLRRIRDERLLNMKLEEDVNRQRMDVDTRDTGAITRWTADRADTPPSEQSYLQIARELGKARALEAAQAQQPQQVTQPAQGGSAGSRMSLPVASATQALAFARGMYGQLMPARPVTQQRRVPRPVVQQPVMYDAPMEEQETPWQRGLAARNRQLAREARIAAARERNRSAVPTRLNPKRRNWHNVADLQLSHGYDPFSLE